MTLAGHQLPPKVTLSAGQRRDKITKGLWTEIRAGRDHSAVTVMGKTDSTRGNKFDLLPI